MPQPGSPARRETLNQKSASVRMSTSKSPGGRSEMRMWGVRGEETRTSRARCGGCGDPWPDRPLGAVGVRDELGGLRGGVAVRTPGAVSKAGGDPRAELRVDVRPVGDHPQRTSSLTSSLAWSTMFVTR